MTIAGSDSSSGAGIQADLKTFAAHRVYGVNALTAVVAEIPGDVSTIFAVEQTLLDTQLIRVASAFSISHAKTGMLANAALVEVTASFFAAHPEIPLVIDPVIRSGAGPELLTAEGLGRLKRELLPLARLVTPNLPEAAALLDTTLSNAEDFAAAPRRLFERYGCSFLVKGGHFHGDSEIFDHACIDGEDVLFSHPRLAVPDVHGTGCTLSAAITAQLALGCSLVEAIDLATKYLTACLEQHHSWATQGGPIAALNHFPDGVVFP